jgi:hypothetical protein
VALGRRRCPECGREYDSGDPASTAPIPLDAAQRTARISSMAATALLAMALLFVSLQCAMGADPLMFGAVLGVLGSPIVLILLILPASARATSRLPWKRNLLLSIALVLAVVATILSNWPLRVQFLVIRDELNEIADHVEAGGTVSPQRVGFLNVYGGEIYEPGVIWLWCDRPAWSFGSIDFLRCSRDFEVWGNVYWESHLDHQWRAVAED